MAKTKVSATRAPRGSRVVTKAFFTALDDVREAQQESVARAAQIMIRDEMKVRGANAGSAATKGRGDGLTLTARAKPVASAKRRGKSAAPKPARSPRRALV